MKFIYFLDQHTKLHSLLSTMAEDQREAQKTCAQCCRKGFSWKTLRYICFQTRRDLRLFWISYTGILIILFIIFMVAFLYKPPLDASYRAWYDETCTIRVRTSSSIVECDRSLRLRCSSTTERCSCFENMFWNGSFCDCPSRTFYTGSHCQERLVFGQTCQISQDFCMEDLICSNETKTCQCPSNSFYNQTSCQLKFPFNSSQICSYSSQCVTGLICSSNRCSCPTSQSWNGYGCFDSATNGEYCSSSMPCDSSARLICNNTFNRCSCPTNFYWDGEICRTKLTNGSICKNTQQCLSNLICQDNYCSCPLINTNYWSTQNQTCQSCFGPDLFLFDGICYRVPVKTTNTTFGNYTSLTSNYTLPTIQYDYQLTYLFNQHVRVFNWTPIFFATQNPLVNFYQWSPDQTLIKPSFFCNDSFSAGTTGFVLSFRLETNNPCLRLWPSSTVGQLTHQLNNYENHLR